MLAAIITKLIKKSIKIIFDPRSPFPEESITKGRWTEGSLSYKAWKSLEAIFLKRSDVTIAIANTYVEHFSKMCPNVRCIVIPNNVDVKKIKPNPKLRINIRSKLELDDDEILFVYIGCMGNLWNNPNIYAKFIIKLRKLYIKHHFLFITPNIEIVKQIFDKYNIKREEYHVVCVEFDAVAEYLCAGDLGINLMAEKDIRLSIKTSEYLAMGFPIIINSNVLGAKEIIEKNKIGLIIEDVVNVNMNKIVALINERENISVKCRELAVKKYSNDKISKQYLNLYKALYRKES
jgi:glycosyltransferase involved in cell wall biosynthesis